MVHIHVLQFGQCALCRISMPPVFVRPSHFQGSTVATNRRCAAIIDGPKYKCCVQPNDDKYLM